MTIPQKSIIILTILAWSPLIFAFGPTVPEVCDKSSDKVENLFKKCREQMKAKGEEDPDFDVGIFTFLKLKRSNENLSQKSVKQKEKIREFMLNCRSIESKLLLDKRQISSDCNNAIVNQPSPFDN